MANSVNYDLPGKDLVEDQIRIRRSADTSDGLILGLGTDARVRQKEVDHRLDALADALGPPRRTGRDVVQKFVGV
jgi:hypothetical protein